MSEGELLAHESVVGEDVSYGRRVQISAIDGAAERVVIGDNVRIGDDVRILAPRVTLGDYVTIHHHTTIYGYDEVQIGDCCWLGQNVILNCTAPLKIGRGVTISAYANVWTHFSGGDPLAGCRFDSATPASIGDDAWLGVQATVAPVAIGARALVLAGAVVTRDVPANTVWGGNPAADLTGKLGAPYQEVALEEKFAMLCDLLAEYEESVRDPQSMAAGSLATEFATARPAGRLTSGGLTVAMADGPDHGTSVFDVRDRTYSKLRTAEEIGFMYFLLPQIKFYPR